MSVSSSGCPGGARDCKKSLRRHLTRIARWRRCGSSVAHAHGPRSALCPSFRIASWVGSQRVEDCCSASTSRATQCKAALARERTQFLDCAAARHAYGAQQSQTGRRRLKGRDAVDTASLLHRTSVSCRKALRRHCAPFPSRPAGSLISRRGPRVEGAHGGGPATDRARPPP